MKKGWVAMDLDKKWFWHGDKPVLCGEEWWCKNCRPVRKDEINFYEDKEDD